jgi:uncharacterized protein YlxP (DUF503 family)
MHLQLPGCTSLKEKRSQIKPVLARLHREFNVSVAETDLNDHWQETVLLCALVANDGKFIRLMLQKVLQFMVEHYPELYVLDHRIEIL